MNEPPSSPVKLAEFSWLERMFASTLKPLQGDGALTNLSIPPGDDCAEVLLQGLEVPRPVGLEMSLGPQRKPPPHPQPPAVLFASDMLMDGVHFDLREIHPYWVGSKAVRVNLSDIAAMAGTPLSITVSLALPRGPGAALGQALMEGAAETCRQYQLTIAGGDTNTWDGPLVISVAVIGLTHPRGSVTRGGARPGDLIFVSGPLGGSLISGRHLGFSPRLELARYLRERYVLSSMLDISDGLGSDLRHILHQSQVGACLDRSAIPLHRDLLLDAASSADAKKRFKNPGSPEEQNNIRSQQEEPTDTRDTNKNNYINKYEIISRGGHLFFDKLIEKALSDGEDFELCWTMPHEDGAKLAEEINKKHLPIFKGLCVTQIGKVTADCGKLLWEDGSEVKSKGYEHQLVTHQSSGIIES